MSLLRLLATGKSLIGLKQGNGRYRVSRERLLPEFGGRSNPFRTRSDVEKEHVTAREGAERESSGVSASTSAALPVAGPTSAYEKQQTKEKSREKGTLRPTAPRLKLAEWAGKCMLRIPTGMHLRGLKPATVISKLPKPLVQGELSLDRVKVVRNDLSDTDLDVIRCKPQVPAGKAAPGPEGRQELEPVDGSWSKLTGRLFGAGKT